MEKHRVPFKGVEENEAIRSILEGTSSEVGETFFAFFFDNYGPTKRALQALSQEEGKSLRKDLEKVFLDFNIANDGTTTLYGEYFEVDALKKL
jgi:hypothetical protein